MNKTIKNLTLFLGFFALTLGSGKTLTMGGFALGSADSVTAEQRIAILEHSIAKIQGQYQEALEIMKQSISEQDKETALKSSILKQNPADISFETFFTKLGKSIDKLQDKLSLPEAAEYTAVKKQGKELLNSLDALYKFARVMSEKTIVELYMKRLDSKYAQSFAMVNSNLSILMQQAELQRILMLSFNPKVPFKYIAFKWELDADIDTLHKMKKKISQPVSIEAVNSMLTKLVTLHNIVTETYCYQQEYRAYHREKQLFRRMDSMFHQLRKQRAKISMLEATYHDGKELLRILAYMFGVNQQPQGRVRVTFDRS